MYADPARSLRQRCDVHVKGRVDEGMEYAVVNIVENAPGVISVSTDRDLFVAK
jgi:hypothetical protein